MRPPIFTYWADEAEAFVHDEGICDCCQNKVNKYHISNSAWWCGWKEYSAGRGQTFSDKRKGKYGNYELHLCYECIASGEAAKKFRIKFNRVVDPSDECEAIGHEEVEKRTPCYRRQSKDSWPIHCGEACVYIEGYAVDMDRVCHDFQCRRCGKTLSVEERIDY